MKPLSQHKNNKSLILTGEVGYMDHTMPLDLVKDQILIDIIHYEIPLDNFHQSPSGSLFLHRTRNHVIFSP